MILLLTVSILAASLNSVLLHKLPSKSDIFTFNLICSAVWLTILLVLNRFFLNLTPKVVFWGILYGIVQMLFLIFKTLAMNSGPVSITTLIGNCSLILSTTVGALVWKESVSVGKIIGIIVLIFAFFLCTYSKTNEKGSKIWVLYCVFFFVFCALVGIIFKCFSKASGGNQTDMMIVASLTMVILFTAKKPLEGAFNGKPKAVSENKIGKAFLIIALVSGVLSCLYNRLNISLAGMFDSAIFYPCFNGGVILMSLLLSVIILKEKITKNQSFGLTIGTLSVLIIGFC